MLLLYLSMLNWVDTNEDYPGVPVLNNWTMLGGIQLPLWIANSIQVWGASVKQDYNSPLGSVFLAVMLAANSLFFYGIGYAFLAAGIDTKYYFLASILPIFFWWFPSIVIGNFTSKKFPSRARLEKKNKFRALIMARESGSGKVKRERK